MTEYLVRIFIGDHHTEITCDEEEIGRWRTAGRIVARAEQDEERIAQFFAGNGFIIKYDKSEEYISPMDVKTLQIMTKPEKEKKE